MGEDPAVSYAQSNEVRVRWRELADAVEHKGEHVIVQRYTRPVAVVVPIKWYEEAKAQIAALGYSTKENQNAHASGH